TSPAPQAWPHPSKPVVAVAWHTPPGNPRGAYPLKRAEATARLEPEGRCKRLRVREELLFARRRAERERPAAVLRGVARGCGVNVHQADGIEPFNALKFAVLARFTTDRFKSVVDVRQ